MMKTTAIAVLLLALVGGAAAACGTTPITPNSFAANASDLIVGGTVAKQGSWPWQIEWCSGSASSCSLMCGGSVIAPNWILTAGHCVSGYTNRPTLFRVRTGVFNINNLQESTATTYSVTKIIIHPQYSESTGSPVNDVALIQISGTITYNNYVQPVCLPSASTVAVPPNTAYATGWGTTSSGGSISTTLRQVNVPYVAYSTCRSAYSTLNNNLMLCAGQTGKDACQGDSGGPLVTKNSNGYWFQYGVTSYGYGCGYAGYAGVYARVSAFCSWIASTTSNAATCVNPSTYNG